MGFTRACLKTKQADTGARTFNPSTWEAAAGRSSVGYMLSSSLNKCKNPLLKQCFKFLFLLKNHVGVGRKLSG